jgi:hypothetical protein
MYFPSFPTIYQITFCSRWPSEILPSLVLNWVWGRDCRTQFWKGPSKGPGLVKFGSVVLEEKINMRKPTTYDEQTNRSQVMAKSHLARHIDHIYILLWNCRTKFGWDGPLLKLYPTTLSSIQDDGSYSKDRIFFDCLNLSWNDLWLAPFQNYLLRSHFHLHLFLAISDEVSDHVIKS